MRIKVPVVETTTSLQEKKSLIFGTLDARFSSKSQIYSCSHSKLQLVLFSETMDNGEIIEEGVVEVDLSMNVDGQQNGTIEN